MNSIDRRLARLRIAVVNEPPLEFGAAKIEEGVKPAYMDLKRLAFETSYSERTIEEMLKNGRFPQPRNKCGKRVWKWSEVVAFMDSDDNGASEIERIRQATARLSHGQDRS